MISYLDKILESSKEKVLLDKIAQPYLTIKSKIKDLEEPSRFIDSINKRRRAGLVSVIAESKKASPSQGLIRENYNPVHIAQSYYDNNATCMSVLTNEEFFKGSLSHLEEIKASVNIPLLRKDFIVDDYQIYESRLSGADCILLIVAALTSSQLSEYYDLASELGMDVLVEVHDEEETKRALEINPQFIGINNRNLKSFEVDLNTTERLSDLIPDEILCISESGIRTKEDISRVLECGVSSFLVGESFMRSKDPGQELQNLFSLKKT
jgi:indole-3-glycerol phosphate synthase